MTVLRATSPGAGETEDKRTQESGQVTIRPTRQRAHRLWFALGALAFFGLLAACSTESDAGVRFVAPVDGATVGSPLAVEMAAKNFILEPAANGVNVGRGHLHIMIDAPCVQARLTVPPDEQHLHFGKAQTSAVLELAPGEHFLCLQGADGNHNALPITHEITITVSE